MSWHEEIKQKRIDYGVKQDNIARLSGISQNYLSQIENGKLEPSEQVKQAIESALGRFSSEHEMYVIFDYVRIRFDTHDIKHIIDSVLKMQMKYFFVEDHAYYGYREQYLFGNICVMESDAEDERGTLIELKGCGCREFECVLEAQERSWFDFFADCFAENGVFKRIDIAINDVGGILSIPELIAKCKKDECHTIFKSYQSNTSGDMFRNELLDEKFGMGITLYLGSLKSDIYFCIYEKDYEQYKKRGIPIEDADVKNRFELRLKNDRALMAIEDLLCFGDIDKTSFEIINNYTEFVDPVGSIDEDTWETNPYGHGSLVMGVIN